MDAVMADNVVTTMELKSCLDDYRKVSCVRLLIELPILHKHTVGWASGKASGL